MEGAGRGEVLRGEPGADDPAALADEAAVRRSGEEALADPDHQRRVGEAEHDGQHDGGDERAGQVPGHG